VEPYEQQAVALKVLLGKDLVPIRRPEVISAVRRGIRECQQWPKSL
jgi:hypothetical protein